MNNSQAYERVQIALVIVEEIDLISTSGFSGEVIPLPHDGNEENELQK